MKAQNKFTDIQTWKNSLTDLYYQRKKKKGKVLQAEDKWYQRDYGSTQGMKSTRNANHMGTCIRSVFSYYLYLFKR